MSVQNFIQDELTSLGSSLPFANSPVFSVPEGYFEGLAAEILAKVKNAKTLTPEAEISELSPLLAGLSKTMPYSVPPSYFGDNLNVVPEMEAETKSAVLSAIGKAVPFEVPNGYFESLPAQILARVAKPQTKLVPLFGRVWTRVAAAAVVAGVVVFAGLQIFSGQPDEGTVAAKTTPLQTEQTAKSEPVLEKAIRQTSTEELEDFIETVQANPVKEAKEQSLASDRKQVAELLKDVPTTEMESFLSALPSADEDLSATDEP